MGRGFSDDASIPSLTEAHISGDESATEELFARLESPVRRAAERFFPAGSADCDDVTQETLIAVFDYLKRKETFEGDLIRFTITVARNRCRNIANQRRRRPHSPLESLSNWIANPDRSPLDLLIAGQARERLQAGLNRLGELCRFILRSFYFEGRSIEEIRRATNLKTVQGVYYRRAVCLREIASFLERSEVIDTS